MFISINNLFIITIDKTHTNCLQIVIGGRGHATSQRRKSYKYFLFDGENSVCKDFYLSTLAISQRMVYDVYEKKDVVTGVKNVTVAANTINITNY